MLQVAQCTRSAAASALQAAKLAVLTLMYMLCTSLQLAQCLRHRCSRWRCSLHRALRCVAGDGCSSCILHPAGPHAGQHADGALGVHHLIVQPPPGCCLLQHSSLRDKQLFLLQVLLSHGPCSSHLGVQLSYQVASTRLERGVARSQLPCSALEAAATFIGHPGIS